MSFYFGPGTKSPRIKSSSAHEMSLSLKNVFSMTKLTVDDVMRQRQYDGYLHDVHDYNLYIEDRTS